MSPLNGVSFNGHEDRTAPWVIPRRRICLRSLGRDCRRITPHNASARFQRLRLHVAVSHTYGLGAHSTATFVLCSPTFTSAEYTTMAEPAHQSIRNFTTHTDTNSPHTCAGNEYTCPATGKNSVGYARARTKTLPTTTHCPENAHR